MKEHAYSDDINLWHWEHLCFILQYFCVCFSLFAFWIGLCDVGENLEVLFSTSLSDWILNWNIYFFFTVFCQLQEGCRKSDSLSSLPHALFNYINSIVGSGIIGIPYALHRAGFGLGLLILALVAVITDYSLILMVRLY